MISSSPGSIFPIRYLGLKRNNPFGKSPAIERAIFCPVPSPSFFTVKINFPSSVASKNLLPEGSKKFKEDSSLGGRPEITLLILAMPIPANSLISS